MSSSAAVVAMGAASVAATTSGKAVPMPLWCMVPMMYAIYMLIVIIIGQVTGEIYKKKYSGWYRVLTLPFIPVLWLNKKLGL